MARLLLSGPVKTNQTASHRENVVSTPGFAAKSTPCKIRYLRPCVPCMFRQHCSTWAKASFDTRPIFHQSDAAIRGHVFVSFLALTLAKELTRLCQEK